MFLRLMNGEAILKQFFYLSLQKIYNYSQQWRLIYQFFKKILLHRNLHVWKEKLLNKEIKEIVEYSSLHILFHICGDLKNKYSKCFDHFAYIKPTENNYIV